MLKDIKAILFDSGRVLNGPVTGHWFITPNFWEHVDKATFDAFSSQNYSVTDKLSQILFTSQDTFRLATIATGATVEASVVNSNNQGGVKYLFVVLQRQLDGKKVNSCYFALQVPLS
mgnify:CR=1 FL=1